MLGHFGEDFDAKSCRGTCDNCRGRGSTPAQHQDVTDLAIKLVDMIRLIGSGKASATDVRDAFR